MSVLEKFERISNAIEKFSGIADKIPRLIELAGVSIFAGRAAERLGGDFTSGALSGAVADGLAHSNLPHNQLGGVALGAYFAALGVINLLPPSVFGDGPDTEGCEEVFETIGIRECGQRGGVVHKATRELIVHNPFFSEVVVVCKFIVCPDDDVDLDGTRRRRSETPPVPTLPTRGECPEGFARRGAGGRCVRVTPLTPDPISSLGPRGGIRR